MKENIVTGGDIDLYELPSPWWNRLDGGRYLLTYGGCVTKDHDTGVMNVGIYRGMVASKTEIPILMWKAQHVGQHATSWERAGKTRCRSPLRSAGSPRSASQAARRWPRECANTT